MEDKQTFNYHTHTRRCGHAVGSDEEYIQAAIKAGITTLGFSEHLGYDGWDDANERIPFKDNDAYLDDMQKLKVKYIDKIDIRIGFEYEFFEDCVDFLKQMKSKCDYMINGQHAIDRSNQYLHVTCSDDDVDTMANQVCRGIELGLTDYLAHPDYFMLAHDELNERNKQAIRRIAVCAKEHHIPIEANLKGMRYGTKNYSYGAQFRYPHKELFAILADIGCDIVFGYDAHNPEIFLQEHLIHDAKEALAGLPLHFLTDLKL